MKRAFTLLAALLLSAAATARVKSNRRLISRGGSAK
jgi:hypothetical protein